MWKKYLPLMVIVVGIFFITMIGAYAMLHLQVLRFSWNSNPPLRASWAAQSGHMVDASLPDPASQKPLKILFFGDLIYTRWVSRYLNSEEKLQNRLSAIFSTWYLAHQTGWDYIWLNLETSVVSQKSICQPSSKENYFCSEERVLRVLKNLWFNIVNLANNHSMDAWINAHHETVRLLKEYEINYAGLMNAGNKFFANYVYTWTWQNFPVAWHWYDFVISKTKEEVYCPILQEYKALWYYNIVMPHWGTEYQTWHSDFQKRTWESLIDCWADLIIGTHPHVMQDIGYYHWKPIIYSLWNFLFDQWFSAETMSWMYADISIYSERVEIVTGSVNSYFK